MAIRGILFDKDGTIIDYWRTWLPVNREAALFAAGGNAPLADELLLAGGHDPATDRIVPGSVLAAGSIEDIAAVFAAYLGPRTPPDLASGIEAVFRDGGTRHSRLVADAASTIAELGRRRYRLGLATNDTIGGLEASLAQHGVLHLFGFTAGCDSGFGPKPGPGMVLGFCAAAGVAPAEVAVVGDAVHDLAMGRAAGAGLNVGVLGGTSAREDLAPFADIVVGTLGDLLGHPAFQGSG